MSTAGRLQHLERELADHADRLGRHKGRVIRSRRRNR